MHSHGIHKIRSGPEPDPGATTTLTPTETIPPCPEKRQAPDLSTDLNPESASPPQGSARGRTSNGTLAPHECTPSEIWAEIFTIVVKGLPVHFPPDFSSPQWVLSRTCSRWRNIAFEESRLWNWIEVSPISTSPAAKLIAFTNSMIFPSGPLSISVQDKEDCPSFSALAMETLILPYLPRMKVLVLHLRSTEYPRLFQAPPESFKFLELLDVNESILQISQNTMTFDHAQELRRLKLNFSYQGDRRSAYIFETPIPWHQLTELDLRLDLLDLATVLWVLRRCTSLQIFGTSINYNYIDAPAEVLILPHLQSLSLWLCQPLIFNHLILPTLTELHLDGIRGSSFYPAIANMLSRSQYSLSVFDAHGEVAADAPAMNMLMECMPEVRVFKGEGLYIDDPTLEMIGRGQLLPSATTLSCSLGNPSAFVDALTRRLGLVQGANSKVVALRSAVGYYAWTGCHRDRVEAAMSRAFTSLERLNGQHGTMYYFELRLGMSRILY